MSLYAFCVWLHVVAAAVWVGSMVFFAGVVVPVLRRPELRATRAALLRQIGGRFRVLGWISLGVLLVTGIANLHYRGIGWSAMHDASFWSSGFGRALGWKLVFVAIILMATAAHEVFTDARAMRELESDPTSRRAEQNRRVASWVGRIVMLASLAVLFFAVALVRGFLW